MDPGGSRLARIYPEEASLRLSALRRGRMRAVRLRLTEIVGATKHPTEFYLDGKVAAVGVAVSAEVTR